MRSEPASLIVCLTSAPQRRRGEIGEEDRSPKKKAEHAAAADESLSGVRVLRGHPLDRVHSTNC